MKKILYNIRKVIYSLIRRWGYDIRRYRGEATWEDKLSDLSTAEKAIMASVRPYTMTSEERMASLLSAVRHISTHKIPGDIVECGVWRGGSMMIVAQMLVSLNDTSRKLYLYDTYEGMSVPTEHDKRIGGQSAETLLSEAPAQTGIWCYASLEDVKRNLLSTGYPKENIIFVKGKVEDTIPGSLPQSVALLRLDTDWYESTKHELEHLFPLLVKNGLLILDDYGHWQGAKKAVDEYFSPFPEPVFLQRIDNDGRLIVKH